jgi:hypothetical protein
MRITMISPHAISKYGRGRSQRAAREFKLKPGFRILHDAGEPCGRFSVQVKSK